MNKKGFVQIALVLGVGLALAAAGGYFAYKFGFNKSEEGSKPEIRVEESNTNSATEVNNQTVGDNEVESEDNDSKSEPSAKPLSKDDSFTSIETDIKNTTILEEDFSDL